MTRNQDQDTDNNNNMYFSTDEESVDAELQAALALSLQDMTSPSPNPDGLVSSAPGRTTSNAHTGTAATARSSATGTGIPLTITTKTSLSANTAAQQLQAMLSTLKAPPQPSPNDNDTVSATDATNEDNVEAKQQSSVPVLLPTVQRSDLNSILIRADPKTTKATVTSEPFTGVALFHQIMWDDLATTDADKKRWVSQGIDFRGAAKIDPDNNQRTKTNNGLSDPCVASSIGWGLVQEHGGPCGVLAAVQAELLRVVLFGDSGSVLHANTIDGIHGTNENLDQRLAQLEPGVIRIALARAIALILARASLSPSAVSASRETATPADGEDGDASAVVRIVLPKMSGKGNGRIDPLHWHDLEPWHVIFNTTEGSSLTVHCISFSETNESVDATSTENSSTKSNAATIVMGSLSATPKRQKVLSQDGGEHNSSKAATASLADRINRYAQSVESFLLDESYAGAAAVSQSSTVGSSGRSPLDYFRRQGGVLLLVLSTIASRSASVIQEEFDDPVGTRLTAQFGHCGQELMNLLLTGQAVSNVFDNTLSPSGDMVCRGIQNRPLIGYLSQLESMRYCEVGGYYKSPLYPIWVVGSTSHFTVMFGDPASLKESKSDMLLDECRRAFKAVEGGEENGFIKTDQLASVLQSLQIRLLKNGDESSRVQTLAASLEVGGAGIILWDDFWKTASRLLTGATLESILQSDGKGTDIRNPVSIDESMGGAPPPPPPPLIISNYSMDPDADAKPAAKQHSSALASYVESDEEMARRLGAEWGTEASITGMTALSSAASMAMDIDNPSAAGVLSDEEMARKLQEQFDSEGGNNAVDESNLSVDGLHGSPIPFLSDTDDNSSTVPTHVNFAVRKPQMSTVSHAFEQYGDSFSLYHYNGLRGGVLTHFRITRLSAEEAVGASIALNRAAGSLSHGSGGGSQGLEDVVRTKWPSCVINWLGKSPPYID